MDATLVRNANQTYRLPFHKTGVNYDFSGNNTGGLLTGLTDQNGNQISLASGAYGAYTDAGTRLVKIGQRYYDPSLGRWTQPDPLGVGNRYTYADCNPVNRIDPSGLVSEACWLALGGFAADLVASIALVSALTGGGVPAVATFLVAHVVGVGLDALSFRRALQSSPSLTGAAFEAAKLIVGLYLPAQLGLVASAIDVKMTCVI